MRLCRNDLLKIPCLEQSQKTRWGKQFAGRVTLRGVADFIIVRVLV